MLALTATATPRVRDDIVRQLELKQPRTFTASFNRPNLFYRVEPKERAFDRLLSLLRNHDGESAIVYCFSRKETERVANDLRANGINALPYHAGLDDHLRGETQERFIRDDVHVIAATIAFGMGIDKPDVRLVVHYSLPKTLEGYYQETGRAGRDGLPSECVLFYSYGDKRNHEFFINQTEETAEREKARAKLRQVIDFCQSAICRRRSVLHYFGEQWEEENCGACDVCLAQEDEQEDATVIAQKILSTFVRTGERFGTMHVIDVLRGSRSRKVLERRHDILPVHGIARNYSVGELRHYVMQLASHGLLANASVDYPVYRLTSAGRNFLRNRESVALAKPKAIGPSRVVAAMDETEFDSPLFLKLRELRKSIADAKGVPPYVVFGDSALRQMARYYPQSRYSLSRISGVGDFKLDEYGEDFLRVILDYATEHHLAERPIPQTARQERRNSRTLSDSYVQTGDLLRQGLPIEAVAERRDLARATVIGHIERLIEAGERFDLSAWLPPLARLQSIEVAFRTTGSMLLGPVRAHLGDDYSYEEIRLVRLRLLQGEHRQPGDEVSLLTSQEV